jgi:hypothetical protein
MENVVLKFEILSIPHLLRTFPLAIIIALQLPNASRRQA